MTMKSKILVSALLAAALSGLMTKACDLTIRIACPNDHTASGTQVCVDGVGCAVTDDLGIATIHLPTTGTFNVCVTTGSLPTGATLATNCQQVICTGDPLVVTFVLSGDF